MTPKRDAGLAVRHNSDLDPARDYLEGFPNTRAVLRNAELLEAFRRLDRAAIASQKSFRLLGTVSLVLGAGSLIAATWGLFQAGSGSSLPPVVGWAAAISALGAVVLALGPRVAGLRNQWLNARFLTEQMRQWHFQSLLDGEFVELAARDEAAFERERSARWARLLQRARNAEGERDNFADAETFELWHEPRPYTDDEIADEAFAAFGELRIRWQQSYFKLKREEFARRDKWTEALARWTLFTAVAIAALEVVLIPARSRQEILLGMGATAITLAILSAAIRVFRSAHAISEERERYESKWTRVLVLREAFQSSRSKAARLRMMREFERVETDELREFLRVARRANFLL